MTKMIKMTTIAAAVAALVGTLPGLVQAGSGDEQVINADMSRRPAGSTSGSGDTVEAECPADPSGNAWQDATANLKVTQVGNTSSVFIKVQGAAPDTLFTVWTRLSGSGQGTSFGGSPITGGGATPMASSDNLGQLVADWVGAGSADQPNGFVTNHNGDGQLKVDLDFPLVGGAYPFNRIDTNDLALAQTKNPGATAVPAVIVNPTDSGIGGPFLLRVISHCQDGLGHGLSPAKREAWFQYP